MQVLTGLNLPVDDRLIVGTDTADDAGVVRLSPDLALVLTVDFFSPIVDDPYEFGAVAAANALSDVYAMGGRPLAALNICAFPPKEAKDLLRKILQGGADKVKEAGALIAGGHTVRDDDLKYGLAVVGIVHPDRVIKNAGARPGDRLVLTKPIGTGLLAAARKKDRISEADFRPAVESMMTLNRAGGEAMVEAGIRGGTDITGFGLLGHAQEMAAASKVGMAIDVNAVPVMPKVTVQAQAGLAPGGTRNNQAHFRPFVDGEPKAEIMWDVLFDAQTSGGLLICAPPDRLGTLMRGLKSRGVEASVIGEVTDGPAGRILLRP